MSDHDDLLATHLAKRRPASTRRADWHDVRRRARRGGRPLVAVAIAVFSLGVGAAALAETVDTGFSDWLTGSPGRPAGEAERDRLREADQRGLASLPGETDLRELMSAEYDERTYRLLGFRTGSAVCLRLAGVDPGDEGGPDSCVAANELERSRDLAVPLRVDSSLRELPDGDPGSGTATFGLVAAEVERVFLVGAAGTREATVANGAFLALGPPDRDNPTLSGYALDRDGRRHLLRLAPALTSGRSSFDTGLPLRGPARIERRITDGRIGWLERGEARGEPLPEGRRSYLPPGRSRALARIIQPDPNDFLRVGLTWPGSPGGEICVSQIGRGGIGTGCAAAPELFARGPFSAPGWTYAGVGTQFLVVSGVASDDVARLELFLGTGEHWPVPLRDNAFATRVQRAKLPARLVAYDRGNHVIGIDTHMSG